MLSVQDQAAQLRKSVTMLSRRLRPAQLPDDLSLAKLSVLAQLYRQGPLTATELAQREGVKIQSLTRLLAELEDHGWLARKPHPSDGRQTRLSLTRQGIKRLCEATQPAEAALARVMAETLSTADRGVLARACALMDQLEQVLDQATWARGSAVEMRKLVEQSA
jgi:DNA-binding MarR family transcriptional regulator